MTRNTRAVASWELAFTLLDKLETEARLAGHLLGISIHPS